MKKKERNSYYFHPNGTKPDKRNLTGFSFVSFISSLFYRLSNLYPKGLKTLRGEK